MQYLDQIPDNAKIAASVAAPVLTLFGVTLEEWTYILSGIVSVLFIVEKAPIFFVRMKTLIQWIKEKRGKSS